ncbi:DUF3231 family protein [Heyndrickxia sporothermodurans]|uniref:DUF3231 family protein n=1 Tax=Heyndrickxia sporothermodurans TaxID=46224 RepID=UPI003D22C160
MPNQPTISSSEVGTLWLTYQEKTFILRLLEYLIPKADDHKSEKIMTDLYKDLDKNVERIKHIFEKAGSALPVGFTSQDVNVEAPRLFENGLDIMFLRMIKEVSMGLYTLNMGKTYREDIINLYKDLTAITQGCYNKCTQYLLEKGMLTRPPFVPMPKTNEFINDMKYLSGLNLLSNARHINTIELSSLFHGMESNNLGMTLMFAFTQVAEAKEVKQYFHKGMEISKKILKQFGEILLEDDITPTISSVGNVSSSKISPFSDKFMLYCNSLLCNLSLGGNAFGFAFSLRNDLQLKALLAAKDVADYANDGNKLMVKNGWLEKPPATNLER